MKSDITDGKFWYMAAIDIFLCETQNKKEKKKEKRKNLGEDG
jgi:hypothetical protein